jgi:hypothetical protein
MASISSSRTDEPRRLSRDSKEHSRRLPRRCSINGDRRNDVHIRPGLAEIASRRFGSAERSLNTGEWKACTVLSGSIIEALLLWALQTHSVPDIASAMSNVDASKQIRRNAPPDKLTDGTWRFHDYIHVAAQLQEIQDPLYSRCFDAKDYRNLIHPAVAESRNAACDRGTSHITIGTVYSLIEKLEQIHVLAP